MDTMQFVLVDNASRARKLRRELATRGSGIGVVVGTFSSLLSHARAAYLIVDESSDWTIDFHNSLQTMDAFWSDSLKVSPDETAQLIKKTLDELVTSLPVGFKGELSNIDNLSSRPSKHLSDLLSLYADLEYRLDSRHELIRTLIGTDSQLMIRHIKVHLDETVDNLSHWQKLLIDKLKQDSRSIDSPDYSDFLKQTPLANDDTCLYGLQSQMYNQTDKIYPLDSSVQFIGMRDFMEETDVAAGMVQEIFKQHRDLSLSDIALMVPDDYEYNLMVSDAFKRAGIPLSGLNFEPWKRDLANEAIFHFLYCRQKPAPVMALSVCLSAALMPWDRETGARLAQQVMDGDYRLIAPEGSSEQAVAMLKLINSGGDDSPASLQAALKQFVALLDDHEQYATHMNKAYITIDKLCQQLEGAKEIPWKLLRHLSTPQYIRDAADIDYNQQGVTIWRETQSSWKSVKHLIVLGFSEGHYPRSSGVSSVFSSDDLTALQEQCQLNIISPENLLTQRRNRFREQLSDVCESISFLISRFNPQGSRQSPSDSLVFMQSILGQEEGFILELDVSEDRQQVRYLACAENRATEPAREIRSDDMSFDTNLLYIRQDEEGNPKPESPSGLETLMISPLAWLLNRLYIQEQRWGPEELDVMTQGTLAHYVFEKLFKPGSSLPDTTDIQSKAKLALDEGILRIAPFLRSNTWQIERANLLNGVVKAAIAWKQVLEELDANVLGSEKWLRGKFAGISIHGQADSIIQISNGQILVVDYKRSSSKSREPRMSKGYDSQAYLYICMLESMISQSDDSEDIIQYLKQSSTPGIVYYMLNDQTALTDYPEEATGQISAWHYVADDVSSHAIELIKSRLTEIQKGTIKLNRSGDADLFEKEMGIKPYALDKSPLIAMFTQDELEEDE